LIIICSSSDFYRKESLPFIETAKESVVSKQATKRPSDNQSMDDTLAMLNVPKRVLTSRSADETDLDITQADDSAEGGPVSLTVLA